MQVIRPAGLNERRCIARDTLGFYGSIITIGTYSSNSSGAKELPRSEILKALKHCVVQHPVLATIVQESETENPKLARLPTIDLADHVRQLEAIHYGDQVLQHLLGQIHNKPFVDYEHRPQWRVYIVPLLPESPQTAGLRFHMAFASSHALADGSSGLYFHKSFLEALNNLPNLDYDEEPLLDTSIGTEVLAPIEQAGNLSISWSFLLKPLLSEFLPPWLSEFLGVSPDASDHAGSSIWTGSSARPGRPLAGQLLQTAAEVAIIPHDILQAVLSTCKKHNARLTALLNHLVARSLSRSLATRDQIYARFAVDTAIDLRRCIPQAQNKMGTYASSSPETIFLANLNAPLEWPAASQSTQTLQTASSTLADQPLGLLKYLSKIRDWVIKKSQTPAEGSFGMSNVGTFDGQTDSTWSITEMFFSQSADATGLPLNINVASAKGGDLNIVLTWWPGMLGVQDERQFVKEVCTELLTQLKEIDRQ